MTTTCHKISYQPPFDWESLLYFLQERTIPGVEVVADGCYLRTLSLVGRGKLLTGWISVTNSPAINSIVAEFSPALYPVKQQICDRLVHLFDLAAEPVQIARGLAAFTRDTGSEIRPGLRLPGAFDSFEMAVRAILGQQISVKAARTLAQRLATTFGDEIVTGIPGLERLFPSPSTILKLPGEIADHLGPLGITGIRARAIRALAQALDSGELSLQPGADPHIVVEQLQTLPGFGPWTAHYVAMRALGWSDAFPHTDLGVKKALPGSTPRQILAQAEAWRPWRAYATLSLWCNG